MSFCRTCGEPSGKLKYCSAECRPNSKDYRAAIRAEFIAAYGGKCQCPGGCNVTEPAFLGLDHTFGGGSRHRRQTRTQGYKMYLLLREQGWPKDRYRLMCWNCNFSRSSFG